MWKRVYALDESEKTGILERLQAENKRAKPAVQRRRARIPPQPRGETIRPGYRRLVQLVLDEDGTLDSTSTCSAKKRGSQELA